MCRLDDRCPYDDCADTDECADTDGRGPARLAVGVAVLGVLVLGVIIALLTHT